MNEVSSPFYRVKLFRYAKWALLTKNIPMELIL